MSDLILMQIYADIVCLPLEICRMITDYAMRKPHVWRKLDPTVDHPIIEPTQTGLQSETTLITAAEPRSSWLPNLPPDATAFVSTMTFADADDEIDLFVDATTKCRQFGVGLVRPDGRLKSMNVYKTADAVHLWFQFDLVSGKAYVYSRDSFPSAMRTKSLTCVRPTDRLCVLLRGLNTNAIVRCGPRSDKPDDGLKRPVFNFDDNSRTTGLRLQRLQADSDS